LDEAEPKLHEISKKDSERKQLSSAQFNFAVGSFVGVISVLKMRRVGDVSESFTMNN
jgi:hypothetical protein